MRNALGNIERFRNGAPLIAKLTCLKNEVLVSSSNQARVADDNQFSLFVHWRHSFSTAYTSVHGEKPSAEYAKLRKESLESEFGQALGTYSSQRTSIFYRFGPFLAFYRAAIVSFHFFRLAFWQLFVRDIGKRAIKFRETLILLGPFYIKLGQALSTRPDILPSVYCQELSKLQDQIPPFSTNVALKSVESQLGVPINKIFAEISAKPVAAASLGQVYKARLHSGEVIAVKVQRPGMSRMLTLDALLFHMIGGQLKRFAKARKDLLVAVNEMVRHMFDEIDYVLEGRNAERFAALYSLNPSDNGAQKIVGIKIPKIYWNLTRKEVLTMEWIDGIKLTDEASLQIAGLDKRILIDQGLYCSLRQLLEVGFFHADPHPGNLVATNSGSLAYFDFGMMGDIPRHYRVGLIQVLVHFVNRDSLGLANDFLSLGFLPEGVDIPSVSDALSASFGDGTRQSRDFESIMNQLYDVMYDFNFSLPPDYALVIRALGSLEGTAKVLDPNFKVVESAYPFVIGRLLADPNPDMRKILMQLLIRNDGSIRWNRLERLMTAISEEASPKPTGWKSFDMRAVVAATEDLLMFIVSEKGWRVRVFLLKDVLRAADEFVGELSERVGRDAGAFESEELRRIAKGFESLREAVKLAPEIWMGMVLRMSLRPQIHSFFYQLVSAVVTHLSNRLPLSFWLLFSSLLRRCHKNSTPP